MRDVLYNRSYVLRYAKKWAYGRNPEFYDFGSIGGDCTNFVSQCIYAGAGVMNYTPVFGWYYRTINDRSPSWTGVKYLSDFLINNQSVGPYGHISEKNEVMTGDVVQLINEKDNLYHTLIVTSVNPDLKVASHSFDSFDRSLSTYNYNNVQFIHIDGVRAY